MNSIVTGRLQTGVTTQRVRTWRRGGLGYSLLRWLRRGFSLALGLAAWQYVTAHGVRFILNFNNLPTPIEVGQQFLILLHSRGFYVNVAVSTRRVFESFAIAAAVGVPLGIGMGRSAWIRDVASPYIEVLRPIPAVAWIPMSILMWPTNEESILYITFLGAFFPIVVNTVHGVQQTPDLLVRAARSLGARRRAVIWHVVLPAALPGILSGFAIGLGICWFSVLTAEMISGRYGIGYFTWKSYQLIQYPDIVVGMLSIGFLGTLSTAAVRLLSRPLLRWLPPEAR
ncbi:MAG: ABC transporter permease [Acidiferrobacteraceae bacterium]